MIPRAWNEAMVRELEAAGVDEYEFGHGGKHLWLRWHRRGVSVLHVMPATASDHRALRNSVATLRRQLGTSAPKRRRTERAPKQRIPRDDAPPPEQITVPPDPFARLAGWGR